MKVLKLQKQGIRIDKKTGAVSKFGMSFCCFEDDSEKNKFGNDAVLDDIESSKVMDDFYDEDSEDS